MQPTQSNSKAIVSDIRSRVGMAHLGFSRTSQEWQRGRHQPALPTLPSALSSAPLSLADRQLVSHHRGPEDLIKEVTWQSPSLGGR